LKQIIYLNGPSSSGKTSLAKALQESLQLSFLRISMDEIIAWMPEKLNDWTGGSAPDGFSWKGGEDDDGNLTQELQVGPYAPKMGEVFRAAVLSTANLGHHIIIDDVAFGKAQVDVWKKVLKNFSVLWVGVVAPLSVLEQRERARGNRILGSSRAQCHKVHSDVQYDLEVDTSKLSIIQSVEVIKSFIFS
jgi:chloramphenicol 3-O phosphotransferase